MALLFYSEDDDLGQWKRGLLPHVPDLEMRTADELGDKSEIDMALVWQPPPGLLASLPNLGVIFSLGAGVDALLKDETLPNVPLCRMIDPSLARNMSEYILYHTLRYYRHFDRFEAQQISAQWRLHLPGPIDEFRVGILGLGELGTHASAKLLQSGFAVSGWSRSQKSIDGVETFCGADQLKPFLAGADVVVCLLPLTDATENMLDRAFFQAMKPGSRLIHVGRGRQLVEDDLLAQLDCGHLSGAAIDVTPIEPLPQSSRLWRHPHVTLSPHAAAYVQPKTGGAVVAANIQRFSRGEPLVGVVDRGQGY